MTVDLCKELARINEYYPITNIVSFLGGRQRQAETHNTNNEGENEEIEGLPYAHRAPTRLRKLPLLDVGQII